MLISDYSNPFPQDPAYLRATNLFGEAEAGHDTEPEYAVADVELGEKKSADKETYAFDKATRDPLASYIEAEKRPNEGTRSDFRSILFSENISILFVFGQKVGLEC